MQARHALASGSAAGYEQGAVAPGVSGHLDWDEFMARQSKFLQVPSPLNPLTCGKLLLDVALCHHVFFEPTLPAPAVHMIGVVCGGIRVVSGHQHHGNSEPSQHGHLLLAGT